MAVTTSNGQSALKPFYLYDLQKGNIKIVNQIVRSDSTNPTQMYIKGDRNLEIIATYRTGERKGNIYRRHENMLEEVQPEFIPHATAGFNSIQFSADGNYIIFGNNNIFVSYQWTSPLYSSYFNNSIANAVSYRTLSPDGLYLFYAESGTMNLRVLNNLNISQELNLTNITPTGIVFATGGIFWIGVGQPQTGKYDVVLRYTLNGAYSTMYFQYDNATNTLTKPTPEPFQNPTPTDNIYLASYITENGKYVAALEKSLLRLYEKQSGHYVQVYNATRVSNGATLHFVAQDASLIVFRTAGNMRVNFLFKCDIQNCERCSWVNFCQTCQNGFVLQENACVCPSETYNLSGVCVACAILNCVSCSASNVCSGCGNGYTLVSNACVCPLSKNISLMTGKCVTCNVIGCYKCETDDICSVFLSPNVSATGNTSNSSALNNSLNGGQLLKNAKKTSESTDRIESVVIVLAVVIGLMLIGMIVIAVILIKILKAAAPNPSVKPQNFPNKNISGQKVETSSILKEENYRDDSQTNLYQPKQSSIDIEIQQIPTDIANSQKLSNQNELSVKCKDRKRNRFKNSNPLQVNSIVQAANDSSKAQIIDFRQIQK